MALSVSAAHANAHVHANANATATAHLDASAAAAADVGVSLNVDAQNISFGIRSIALDANTGMSINGDHVKMRGFCDHDSFGGVGAALPARVNLYRAQAIRMVGGNSWRMVSM